MSHTDIAKPQLDETTLLSQHEARLYNFVTEMGINMSPQAGIEYYRKNYPLYNITPIQKSDIHGISYAAGFILLSNEDKDNAEIWIENDYIHPDAVEWVQYDSFKYAAIFNQKYTSYDHCRVFINSDILFRHHKIESDNSEKLYVKRFDISNPPYNRMDMFNSMFFISRNKVFRPAIEKINDSTIEVRVHYKTDVDFMVCSNLQRVVECRPWKREYVSPPNSNKLYCAFIVDNNEESEIDARFYPAIKADGLVRVYTKGCREVKYPSNTFLINYKDFADIWDPYNPIPSEIPEEIYHFLKTYQPSGISDVIVRDDIGNEALIYSKLAKICAGCYNICDTIPSNYEHSNFIICDNSNTLSPYFIDDIDDFANPIIRSTIPYLPYRDIVIYNGYPIYSDSYGVVKKSDIEYYAFDANKFQKEKLTLIRFNTATDSFYANLEYYIDENKFLNLYIKMNRFYRNLMALRIYEIQDEKEEVYVGTTEPPMDEHLWFEYIVNLVPEEFDNKVVTIYKNKSSIPEPIREAMYSLELPEDASDTGNSSYTSLMDTYFKLTSYYKDHLVLHHEPGVDDPNIAILNTVQIGNLNKNPDLKPRVDNEFLLDSDDFTEEEQFRNFYYYGETDYPEIPQSIKNDLYVKVDAFYKEPENTPIGAIEYGNYTPSSSINKLWIEPELPESSANKPDKDSLDSVSENFFVAKSLDDISDSAIFNKGDYGIDGIQDIDEMEKPDIIYTDDEVSLSSNSLFQGLMDAVSNHIQTKNVENPTLGMYALDDSPLDEDGNIIVEDNQHQNDTIHSESELSKEIDTSISKIPRIEKESIVKHFITDDEEPQNPEKNDWWFQYISKVEDYVLNTMTRKIVLCKSLFDVVNSTKEGQLAMENDEFPAYNESQVFVGTDENTAYPDESLLIKSLEQNQDGSLVDWETKRKDAIKYIVSLKDPVDVEVGDLWFKLAPFKFKDVIDDVLSSVIIECGTKLPETVYPNMVLMDDGSTYETTALLDYGIHGDENEVDIFQTRETMLYPYEKQGNYTKDDLDTIEDGLVFYEWLDSIYPLVCYSSLDAFVLRIDNHLIGVQIEEDTKLTIMSFDDILMKFEGGNRAVKYVSILADLMESGTVKKEDVMTFYTRLITSRDVFDPKLHRIFTRTSNVIAGARTEYPNFALVYSSNIGRFTMDYRFISDREQENAYRMIIDLRDRDFAYLKGRMLLFVNGSYIHPDNISEPAANYIKIDGFDEVIAVVDIFYNKQDEYLIGVKKAAASNYPYIYQGTIIHEKEYGIMSPIYVSNETVKGYYDVLLNDYIFNGYLLERIEEIGNDEKEMQSFINELLDKFLPITDRYLFGTNGENRIVIPLLNDGTAYYEI